MSIPPSRLSPGIWQSHRTRRSQRPGLSQDREATNRTDRHHRHRLPVSRRERPGSVLAVAARRRGCHPRSSRGALRPARVLRSGSGGPGQNEHALGRLSRAGGSVRCPFLWHLAAGSVAHGSPATPVAGGGLGSVAGCRAGARASGRHPDRRVHRHLDQRLRPDCSGTISSASMPTPAPAMP